MAVVTDELRADLAHLQRLVSAWGMVADLCFGDLLLFVPAGPGDAPETFTVQAQVRPTTNQTLYQDDLVGSVVATVERPLLGDVWAERVIRDGQNYALRGPSGPGGSGAPGGSGGLGARVVYIPVQRVLADGTRRCVGIVTRESAVDAGRRAGRLEGVYLAVFDRLATMIADGAFPFAPNDEDIEPDPPRVGDGVITADACALVTYASPNAISSLHRLGVSANAEGRPLADLLRDTSDSDGSSRAVVGNVAACFHTGTQTRAEAEFTSDRAAGRVSVVLRAIPLLGQGAIVGAIVLLRDVSDIRRRDRLLVTKDATIREVHHRVKNNLQTISALLRLQGRRLASQEVKDAIEESVRRIRTIALVHETLSRDVRDAVPFDDIVRPLVRMVEEGLASPDRPLRFKVEGELGDLPPETATPLAVVLTELLQNAVEHAYPDGTTDRRPGVIKILLANDADGLSIDVRDNGVGLPDGFSLSSSKSLGLSIVRTLVTSELGGVIAFRTDGGAVVQLRIPRVADPRGR